VGSRLTSDEEIKEIQCGMCIESDLHCIGFLYGCKNLSFTLREKSRLMMFVNRILKKILVCSFVYCIVSHFEIQKCSPID
jgi:hypothetical protein